MPFPSFPTDNLHKFSALGGLALIIGAFYVTFLANTAVDDTLYPVNAESAALTTEYAYIISENNVLDRLWEACEKAEIAGGEPKPLLRMTSEQIRKRREELSFRQSEVLKQSAILREKIKLIHYRTRALFWVAPVAIALVLTGAYTMVFGFRGWRRIQKVQDALFFQESQLKTAEFDEQLKERAERNQAKDEAPSSG